MKFLTWKYWKLLKWSLMLAAIFWMFVFQLSEKGLEVPEFVYVNF